MDYRKDILVQVLEYMEKNIIEGLSVEKVSIVSGYSKWHLQRLFKHYFGITLGTYIRNRKLSRSLSCSNSIKVTYWMSPWHPGLHLSNATRGHSNVSLAKRPTALGTAGDGISLPRSHRMAATINPIFIIRSCRMISTCWSSTRHWFSTPSGSTEMPVTLPRRMINGSVKMGGLIA